MIHGRQLATMTASEQGKRSDGNAQKAGNRPHRKIDYTQ